MSEGIVLDHTFYFMVIFGEFLQAYEVTTNTMDPGTTDAIALGPSGSLQRGIRCFSLIMGNVLQRKWKDATVFKFSISAISRIIRTRKK